MDLVLHYGPSIVSGFFVTVYCWAVGSALGMVLGFVLALLQASRITPVRWLVRAYIEVIRGTPFLVQLYFLYVGGPAIGLRLDATPAGILALGLYASAYFAEIFRAGFLAVRRGQIEAAASLGMPPFAILRRVIFPQMLVAILPSLVNMLILLTKETVILSIITVPELMYQMQTMAAETFAAFQTIFAMAIFYWFLVEVISRLGRRVEARLTRYLSTEQVSA